MPRSCFSLVTVLFLAACGPGPREIADAAADAAPDAPPPPDAAPDARTINCAGLPTGPVSKTFLPGFVASEDLAFDKEGWMYESDTINLYKTRKDGTRETFVAGFGFRAGMRLTPNGALVVNSDQTNSIVRVDPDGSRYTLLSNVGYPNGMEVDQQGFVYVGAQNDSRVYRLDPMSPGSYSIIADVSGANGLTFNRDYTTLYMGGFSGEGTIYAVDISPNGTPSNFRPWRTNVGTGLLDGMAVDACNNVYIADYGQSEILRIDADGGNMVTVVDGQGAYMPNFDWGSGFGSWEATKLYIITVGEGLFEVDLGVDSKPRW